jgi:hypothetical protein
MNPAPSDPLLKPDALNEVRIAISASESSDLLRLGLVETHFRLALAEIARSVLVSGGKLAYGGHLDPDGYTVMLMKELHRYGRRDRPLRIYLAWQEHRKLSKAEYNKQVEDLGLSGEIVCLDLTGKPTSWDSGRGADPEPVTDASTRIQALSGLRVHMAQNENGRVIIGGKRSGFEGAMPGVLEEAVASIANGQPLYVAGGFGGVAADIVMRMGILGADWLPKLADAHAPEARLVAGLDKLSMLVKNQGWPKNGLLDTENAQLAATHRPSEIAALVSLGLGRRFSKST